MGISSPLVDLQHQYDLLQKEYEYEKETYRQQSERTGLKTSGAGPLLVSGHSGTQLL